MLDFAQARRTMVDCQVRPSDVTDRAVLAAMAEVPRETFVPDDRAALAYSDLDVVVGKRPNQRFMLQPAVIARLIQALEIEDGARALDVGGGFGYSAALLAALGCKVTLLESDEFLASEARARLGRTALPRPVEVAVGPLDAGCPAGGPFDAILINGAVEARPAALLDQLGPEGRLACLHRRDRAGRAVLYVKSGDAIGERELFDCAAPALAEFEKVPAFQF
jgi:protein-L-isoaspartate(D-aspartate) O-methyltransferase